MQTHKETFTDYLRNAQREGSRIVEQWNDWLDREMVAQCQACREYGRYGTEVHANEMPDGKYCEWCMVNVWGWTNDGTYLEVQTVEGEEKHFLNLRAQELGDTSGIDRWGEFPNS